MNWIDFVIGVLLMNAMPHLILGIWRVRMLSGLGFGNSRNIIWGLLNLLASVALYLYVYQLENLSNHGIYIGSLVMLILFTILSPLWRRIFANK